MQFSYTWLKTQANPNLSADQLSHLLTMAGLEVEELNAAAPDFSGVVVAEVKSVEKHPDADRLNVTQVDAGTGELIQIVCGAPNVKVGIKVPCALPNALLPNDFKIKPTKMRGVVSNGMLCSAKELGLEDKVDGLLVLPENAPVGQNIREFLDLDDAIFTLKITPNRTDCLSIKGIAREVSALTQCEFNPIQINHIATQTTQKQAVQIDAPNDCGRFISRVISGVNATVASPDWLVQRLERSGIRSISPLVDIGNYVMLEIGQPMHVFDADKISGSLHVRRAKNGEVLDCLNEKTVTLADNTLVIADEQQALSIAGLMGGAASAVSDETKNIVLEVAWFNPLIISGKSRQYGFGSDSSFRFERGVDSELQRDAIERATELVVQICGGEVGEIVEVLGDLPTAKTVEVRTARVEKVLGVSIENQRIETILQHLGLQPEKTADGFRVTAPSFRYDIEIEADLIEEIARVYGYENIPDDYTSGKLAMLKLPENRHSRFGVYQKMAARGFQEVVSYAFVDEQWEQDFANNQDPIRLQNPLAAQYAVMRSTLMGGLIEILQNNLNRKQNRVRVFEIARIFRKENNQFVQTERVGGLVYGSALPEQWGEKSHPVDFYDLKADVETLLRGKNAAFVKAEHSALHPGRCAAIVVDGVNVGIIGELHPKWTQKYDLPQAPLLFELDMDAVLTTEKVRYQAVSKFQAGRRDLAFVLPENVAFADLQAALGQVNNPIIQGIELFDVYRGAGLPENHKSLAVKISLQDMNATLTDETVEPIIQELIAKAETVGAKLR
ncbi:phenylalanine--tRNA ligase subunit beta [Kingella kingae]|uniref:phenylalanine--tRNA ligase subunit beta n=1 Tax=Kingella kingae TaxID=504 RepID=UPI000407479B|nr:phenylalanine--tRNA ligase subunit beta [Kingella kingae]MBD3613728.1 phenylalanine--tRNA ligase subunit beta [Kingella kingae]MBD3631933.1 phenylalanine--tRNA ligase subunit beta [Kingella kingae]MBD3659359.1 phenylalanine--tRNA ligase subunit beta [Kingella kingae]MDK4544291.1 phenylalanine--tRNA ligase subunit beta [Kingella kingae]MDK4565985.1 phenylalanine--tRNA ligase subunit beta [Kingella kingae]